MELAVAPPHFSTIRTQRSSPSSCIGIFGTARCYGAVVAPRCDYRHANEGGIGRMFVPVVTHEERIAFETLEAGETVLIARSETIQRRDVLR